MFAGGPWQVAVWDPIAESKPSLGRKGPRRPIDGIDLPGTEARMADQSPALRVSRPFQESG